jgi:anti-anti-sigma factor
MSADFDVAVVNRNGRTVVFVHGEMDLAAKVAIHDALAGAQQECAEVVVDLSHLTFMDSTGINALLRAHREAPEGRFHVVGASEQIRRLFDITGVTGALLEEVD